MITLLTDFGAADYFVPALKGAILSIHSTAQIIDLTHEIAPHGGADFLGHDEAEARVGTRLT